MTFWRWPMHALSSTWTWIKVVLALPACLGVLLLFLPDNPAMAFATLGALLAAVGAADYGIRRLMDRERRMQQEPDPIVWHIPDLTRPPVP